MRFVALFLSLLTVISRADAEQPSIAYVGPSSGNMFGDVIHERNGFLLAVTEAKANGAKFDYAMYDDECAKVLSLVRIDQAFNQYHAFAVIGAPCLRQKDLRTQGTGDGAFISTSAFGRTEGSQATAFYLGIPEEAATKLASELELATGQKVSVRGDCFPSGMRTSDDASVCPVISVEQVPWRRFRDKYISAFRLEPDRQGLITYTATKLALDALQRAGGRKDRVVKELQTGTFDTPFGSIRPSTPNPLGAYMVAAPGATWHREKRDQLAALTSKKKCDACIKAAECPQNGRTSLFYVEKREECCSKTSECPQGMLLVR